MRASAKEDNKDLRRAVLLDLGLERRGISKRKLSLLWTKNLKRGPYIIAHRNGAPRYRMLSNAYEVSTGELLYAQQCL